MKIMIIASQDRSLTNFRAPLICALVARRHEVVACAPAEAPEVPGQLQTMGARFAALPMRRTGLNPFTDILTFLRLRQCIARERPDAIITVNIKPVIYGSLAAAWSGVPRIYALIPGLGSVFAEGSSVIVRAAATTLYRLALRRCRVVFAQNPDIAEFLLKVRAVRPGQIVTVRGSGVDLARYQYAPVRTEGRVSFLLLARLLKDKGICEYVEAARSLKAQFPHAEFRMAGPTDPNPNGIPLETVSGWHNEGVIEYLPFQNDVRPLLEACTVYVLPSYYPEGIPRSVLEAMAVGRPIITTNAIGCRETVRKIAGSTEKAGIIRGENGFLVPMRSAKDLTEAMRALATDPALVQQMGRRSREIVEAEFDAEKVSQSMIAAMGL